MFFTPQQADRLLDVAREAIRSRLGQTAPPRIGDEDPALLQPAGCFVSLHRRETHALRGCVGQLQAKGPLIELIRETAAGVLEDPRFVDHPVTFDELPLLEIDLSILSPLRPAAHPLDFDLLRDGIYLTIAGRVGVFLPQVARETGWTKEQLLSRLCSEKLGLAADAWRSFGVRLEVFSTVIVGPVAFEP